MDGPLAWKASKHINEWIVRREGMKKDITIGFRTDREIRSALEKIAEEGRQTISSVIETILYNHMKTLKLHQGCEQEQRRYTRKQVSLPAFILDQNKDAEPKGFRTGKVLDISLGGIRLSIPQGVKLEISSDGDTNEFHIVFTLPDATQPINMKCKPQRVSDSGEDVYVGASFVDGDFHSYQNLQKYLI